MSITPEKIEEISKRCVIPSFEIEDFKLIQPIGEGSYGIIYLIEKIQTGQQYAFKKILCKNLKEIIKYKEEFELIYSMNHENIMKIYGLKFKYLDLTTYSIYVLMELARHDWYIEICNRVVNKHYYKETELIGI